MKREYHRCADCDGTGTGTVTLSTPRGYDIPYHEKCSTCEGFGYVVSRDEADRREGNIAVTMFFIGFLVGCLAGVVFALASPIMF